MTKPSASSAGRTRREPGSGRRRLAWLAVATIAAALAVAGYLVRRAPREAPVLAAAGQVQSAVEQEGDSLQVIIGWRLTAVPESLRIEVQIDSMDATAARVRVRSGVRHRDTLYVPAPAPGTSAEGLSCVATLTGSRMSRESCTPWRYVRPFAEAPGRSRERRSAVRAEADPNEPGRIVVRPGGLQVDPDIGGRCAAWQEQHPTASVWIEVNRTAVAACTGPNNRPTVAQFCAFAELADGRRVKTANSADVPYCDELFRRWERERLS